VAIPRRLKEVIQQENLGAPIAQLAKETLDNSYVIPFPSLREARPHHKVQLFYEVIKMGFDLSVNHKIYILLPAPFFGPVHLSLFATLGTRPDCDLQELRISFPRLPTRGYFAILPMHDKQRAQVIFAQYNESVHRLKHEAVNYLSVAKFSTNPIGNVLLREYRLALS
jgi:hypothetical protein